MTKKFRFPLFGVLPILALFGCDQESEKVSFPVFVEGTGCLVEQITSEPFDEYQFQGVSRDGEWLSYAWDKGEDENGNPVRGVINLNLITGEKVELVEPVNNSGTFSADGKFLTGSRFTDTGRNIFEYNLLTKEMIEIAPHEALDFLPSFSPDGQFILFNSYRSGNNEVYLYNRSAETLNQLTNYEGYDAHGEFSPNGKKILFHRMISQKEEGGYDFELIVYDMETGQETQITPGSPFEESYGSWAPDGRHVVFSSDFEEKPEQHNLYVLGSDGEIIAQLTDGDWPDTYSYWTRNGAYIYFQSKRFGQQDIFRMPMEGFDCQKTG